ncbi:CD1107 family mobile element protein, partial [Clostridioides difficile]
QPMKKTSTAGWRRWLPALCAALIFTVPAYAQSSEPQPETAPSPAETEAEPETQNPFTPDGTGTVVDNATDEDGKEFYTITTADESVFYLVIDKQKTSENVYFLNTCYHRRPSASC